MNNVSARTLFIVSAIFLLASWILYKYIPNSNAQEVSVFTVVLGGILFMLALANAFEKTDHPGSAYDNIPPGGLKIKTNIFPFIMMGIFFGSIFALVIWQMPDATEFYVIGGVILAYFLLMMVRSYALYPDRLELLDLAEFPHFSKIRETVYFKDVTEVRVEDPHNLSTYTRVKAWPASELVQFAKKDSFGKVIIISKASNRPTVLSNVYFPEDLAGTIKKLKNN